MFFDRVSERGYASYACAEGQGKEVFSTLYAFIFDKFGYPKTTWLQNCLIFFYSCHWTF